jgi:hypothetical protein
MISLNTHLLLKQRLILAINNQGGILLSEYLKAHEKVKIKCENNHIWETKPYYITTSKSWCPFCSKNRKLTQDYVENFIQNKKGILLSPYSNLREKIDIKCQFGHVWTTVAGNIINSNAWCPTCVRCRKYSLDDMYELAKTRGGKCLSEIYVNSHTKIKWQCKFEHTFFTRPSDVRNSYQWCPTCKQSKGEYLIELTLKKLKINYNKQQQFYDCLSDNRRKLLFDFYLPTQNVLIEFDGRQHYELVRFNGTSIEKAKKSYEMLKRNDEIKNHYAREKFIRLLRISYKNKEEIEEILNKFLFF